MGRLFLLIFAVAWSVAASSLDITWKQARAGPATPHENRHTIHSYFNTSPESPDGRWLLYYTSATAEGYQGDIRILERATGRETILAKNVTTEDAHRAACQQWVSSGRRVVFHDFRDGQWIVASVDLETLQEKVLATGRQVSWGQPHSDLVPLYGPHFDPDGFTDLEIVNVVSGERKTVVTARQVKEQYSEWVDKAFADKRISIFFPVLSPDLEKIFFKIASAAGGHFRSTSASIRKGLICYDLKHSRFLFRHESWGHPSWHPNAKTIMNMPNVLIDASRGAVREIPGLPTFPGSHPSVNLDAQFFTTDTRLASFGGEKDEYGIVAANLSGGEYRILYRFDNSKGAASWRRSHPHPVFSADGHRIYFNVSDSNSTRLFVAEYP